MYVDFCLIVLAVFLTSPMKENIKKVVVSFVNVAVVVIISERKKITFLLECLLPILLDSQPYVWHENSLYLTLLNFQAINF